MDEQYLNTRITSVPQCNHLLTYNNDLISCTDIDPPGAPRNLKVTSLKWTNEEYQQCVLSWKPPISSVLPVRKYKVFVSVRDGSHVYYKSHVVPAVSHTFYPVRHTHLLNTIHINIIKQNSIICSNSIIITGSIICEIVF